MNGMELSPNQDKEERVSGQPFNIDVAWGMSWNERLGKLAAELSESPIIIPSSTLTEYVGIPVGSIKDGYGSRDISIQVTNNLEAPPTTELILSAGGPGKGEQRTYKHRAPFDAWEEIRPKEEEPRQIMDTAHLVDALKSQLPHGVFDLDRYPNPEDASEIVMMLTNYLRIKARSNRRTVTYKVHSLELGGETYMGERETDFIVRTIGNRITRGLFIASLSTIVNSPLRRTYGYEIVEKNDLFASAKGSLELKTDESFSQLALDELAQAEVKQDKDGYDGKLVIPAHIGLKDIRRVYGLTEHKN